MEDESGGWYEMISILYLCRKKSELLLHDKQGTVFTSLSINVLLNIRHLLDCITYGLRDNCAQSLQSLLHSITEGNPSLSKLEDVIVSVNDNPWSCCYALICQLLSEKKLHMVLDLLHTKETILDYYGIMSIITNEEGYGVFRTIVTELETCSFTLPFVVEEKQTYKKSRPTGSTESGVFSSLFGSFLSTLQSSVSYIDDVVDTLMMGSSSRRISLQSDLSEEAQPALLRWLQEDKFSTEKESIFCVPVVLGSALNWLEKNWNRVSAENGKYSSSSVIGVLEFYRVHGVLPDDCDGDIILYIIVYILENLDTPLFPSNHYRSMLLSMFLYEEDAQIPSIQCCFYDMSAKNKVILDRIITSLSQLILAEPEEQSFFYCRKVASLFAPAMFHCSEAHIVYEGEKLLQVDFVENLLKHSGELLHKIRREIEIVTIRVSDKKFRIKQLCTLVDVPVDISSLDGLSSQLLNRLWTDTIGLYYRARNEPIPPFNIVSSFWKMIGFQRETPITDFRGGGILSLIHLVSFVEHYPHYVLNLMEDPNEMKLPLAIACINLSLLLIKQLHIYTLDIMKDLQHNSSLPIWSFANQPGFHILMFCDIAIMTFQLFKPGEAFFLQFTPLLQEVSQIVKNVLEKGAWDVVAFRKEIEKESALVQKGSCIVIEEEHVYIDMDGSNGCFATSLIIDSNCIDSIASSVSVLYPELVSKELQLVYRSSYKDTLHTFLSFAQGKENTLLIIQDENHHVFGAYQSDIWKYCETFYGNQRCCIFRCNKGKDPSCYNTVVFPYSKQNSFVRLSTDTSLIIGGGYQHAILLDSDMHYGSSGFSATFKSACLSSTSDFRCCVLELWSYSI